MSLHGEMLQKERSLAYNQFCIAKTGSVLLCTVRDNYQYSSCQNLVVLFIESCGTTTCNSHVLC